MIYLPPTVLAIDLETTGLSAQYDYITQIGAVLMEDGEVISSPFYERVAVGAKAKFSLEALNAQLGPVVGNEGKYGEFLSNLVNAPSSREIAEKYAVWSSQYQTHLASNLAQNASFDHGFVGQWLFQQKAVFKRPPFSPVWVCLMELAKLHSPGGRSYNLDAILTLCGLPPRPEGHDAFQDAILAGRAYHVIRQDLIEKGIAR